MPPAKIWDFDRRSLQDRRMSVHDREGFHRSTSQKGDRQGRIYAHSNVEMKTPKLGPRRKSASDALNLATSTNNGVKKMSSQSKETNHRLKEQSRKGIEKSKFGMSSELIYSAKFN